MKKTHRFLIAIVLLVFIPMQSAHADAGPKPSMEFVFVFKNGTPLQIIEGDLMECEDIACNEASRLPEMGPQGFRCDGTTCSSIAYKYAEQFFLVMTFSDGVTRASNLFGKKHFDAYYQVTVRADDMVVEETGGRSNPMVVLLAGIISGLILFTGLAVGLVVILIKYVAKGKDVTSGEGAKIGWYIAAWIIGAALLLASVYFSLAALVSAGIELLLGWLYSNWRKLRKRVVLTVILVANALTSPVLWALFSEGVIQFTWLGILIGEVFIWLAEAVILYVAMRKTIKFGEALLVSLVLNAASFGVGLLLPF